MTIEIPLRVNVYEYDEILNICLRMIIFDYSINIIV